MGSAVLQAQGLCFSYPQRVLFTDWTASIPAGVNWVQGDDGSGKTTLLRLLGAELLPQSGELQIGGVRLADQPDSYRSQVFWADPHSRAHDALTPLVYWESIQSRYVRWDADLLLELAHGLSLTEHLHKAMYMLSTGSKRKVWLAAAFASGATVTLLDEPFAALDKASIALVLELLQEAATHPARAWLVADYQAPRGVPLAVTIALGDCA